MERFMDIEKIDTFVVEECFDTILETNSICTGSIIRKKLRT